MPGIVVFDDAPELAIEGGESGRSLLVVDTGLDRMVMDRDVRRLALQDEDIEDFIVFDTPSTLSQLLEAEPELIVMDAPAQSAAVIQEEAGEPVLVIQSGGRPGPQGPPGADGADGQDGPGVYYQEFGFASPTQIWTIVHNRNTFGLNVETVDINGDPMEGHVIHVDANVIDVHWYYPTAGTARVFR
jgi:hypothetical protein